MTRFSSATADWLPEAVGSLRHQGYAIVEGVVDADTLERTRAALYDVQARIREDIGEERLTRAGELGVLRLMLRYDQHFARFLELPEVLGVVDEYLAPTAVLHLQNGFILPSREPEPDGERVFQQTFHMDFPRFLNGYVASVNTFFAIDDFTEDNGGTIIVPATHQKADRPDDAFLENEAVAVECPAGSMIAFDSTLWHAAGVNRSGKDRLAINQQFTRSWIKPQIDYVRALGDEFVEAQEPRTQQLLGWYTRVVTSLDDYYQPAEKRLYRSGQG